MRSISRRARRTRRSTGRSAGRPALHEKLPRAESLVARQAREGRGAAVRGGRSGPKASARLARLASFSPTTPRHTAPGAGRKGSTTTVAVAIEPAQSPRSHGGVRGARPGEPYRQQCLDVAPPRSCCSIAASGAGSGRRRAVARTARHRRSCTRPPSLAGSRVRVSARRQPAPEEPTAVRVVRDPVGSSTSGHPVARLRCMAEVSTRSAGESAATHRACETSCSRSASESGWPPPRKSETTASSPSKTTIAARAPIGRTPRRASHPTEAASPVPRTSVAAGATKLG